LLQSQLREAQLRQGHLRRWMVFFAFATVAIVGLTWAMGAILINRTLERMDSVVAAAKAQPANSKAEPAPKAARPAPVVPAKEKPPAAEVDRPKEPAAKEEQAPSADDRSLEAVGGMTAVHLYQSYINIGLITDAWEFDVYSESETKKLLSTVLGLMDTVDRQVARLPDSDLGPEDRKRVAQFRQLSALLRVQAKEIRAYWDTPEKDVTGQKEHIGKYKQAREEAWAGIREMLNIKED
jgi:hypothetical protein